MKSEYQLESKNKPTHMYSFFASSFFWRENRPNWSQYLLEFISNLQLIGVTLLGLSLSNLAPPETTLPAIIQKTAKACSLIDLGTLKTDQTLMTLLFGGVGIYFCIYIGLAAIVITKHFTKGQISGPLHYLLTYWAQFHHTTVFWVLNVFIMSTITSDAKKRIMVFKFKEPNSGLVAGSLFLVFLNYLFGSLGAAYCYDPFLTNNTFASYNSVFQRLTFLHKAILSPLTVFISDSDALKWIFVGLSLILTLVRYEIVFTRVPFYNSAALKMTSLMASSALGIAITNVVTAVLSDYNYLIPLDVIYIEGFAILLLFKLTTSRVETFIQKSISLIEERQLTQRQIFKKIFALSHFADKANFSLSSVSKRICNESLLNLVGDFSSHKGKCVSKRCICHHILAKKRGSHANREGLFEVHRINNVSRINLQFEILSSATKLGRGYNISKILCAYILIKEHGNFAAALFTLFAVNEKEKTLQEEILIYYVSRFLEDEMAKYFMKQEEKSSINIDVKQAVDFEDKFVQMFGLIKRNTGLYAELWEYFQKPNINLRQFFLKSKEVEDEASKIQKIWNDISCNYDFMSSHIYALYCTYLMVVRNLNFQAEEIYLYFHNREMKLNQGTYFLNQLNANDNKNDIICYVSVAKDRLGRILHMSKNIFEQYGWGQTDLKGRNIKTIQPPFLREKHDEIILRHIEGTRPQITGIVQGFVQNVEGYISPIDIKLTIFPYVGREPIYTGLFRKRIVKNDFMIIRNNGIVDCFSEKIGKELELVPEEKIHISQICPTFEVVRSKILELIIKPNGNKNNEVLLIFQSASKETRYIAQFEILKVLEERLICLNLYSTKTSDYMIPKFVSSQMDVPVNRHQSTTEEVISGGIADELETVPYNFEIVNHNTESALLTPGKVPTHRRFLLSPFANKRSDEVLYTSKRLISPRGQLLPSREFIQQHELQRSHSGIELVKTDMNNFLNKEREHKEKLGEELILTRNKKDLNSKLEEAVYYIPNQRFFRWLNYFVVFFLITCSSLLIVHYAQGQSELGHLLEKVDLILICQGRSFALVGTNISVRMLALITSGIISEQRHVNTMGVNPWSMFVKNWLTDHVNSLYSLNPLALDAIYSLDQDSLDKIRSNQYLVKEQNSSLPNRFVSRFEIINEVANAGHQIESMDISNITLDNPTVRFVLDNTLNDPLVSSESAIESLKENYEISLDNIRNDIMLLYLLTLSLGACILALLCFDNHRFLKKRDQFIEILLKIDENKLLDHLKLISKFYTHLQHNTFNLRSYFEMRARLGTSNRVSDFVRPKKKSRYGNWSKLNLVIIRGFLLTLATILLLTSIYIGLFISFQSTKVDLLEKRDKTVQMTQIRTDMVLLTSAILAYISEGSSVTIRNKPIEQQMNEIMFSARLYPNIFSEFHETTTKGSKSGLLQSIIERDLCSVVNVPQLPISICVRLSDVIGAKGIVRMISNILNGQVQAKNFYDQSNHTIQAAYEAYATKEQVVAEGLISFLLNAVDLIQSIFREDMTQTINDLTFIMKIIVIVYSFICFILGSLIILKVFRAMKKERESWRKIIRHIPFSIISSNKLLKAFLVNNCEHMLDSVKNLI